MAGVEFLVRTPLISMAEDAFSGCFGTPRSRGSFGLAQHDKVWRVLLRTDESVLFYGRAEKFLLPQRLKPSDSKLNRRHKCPFDAFSRIAAPVAQGRLCSPRELDAA